MHNVKIDFTHPATVIKSKEKDKNKTPAGVKVIKDKWVKKWLVNYKFYSIKSLQKCLCRCPKFQINSSVDSSCRRGEVRIQADNFDWIRPNAYSPLNICIKRSHSHVFAQSSHLQAKFSYWNWNYHHFLRLCYLWVCLGPDSCTIHCRSSK